MRAPPARNPHHPLKMACQFGRRKKAGQRSVARRGGNISSDEARSLRKIAMRPIARWAGILLHQRAFDATATRHSPPHPTRLASQAFASRVCARWRSGALSRRTVVYRAQSCVGSYAPLSCRKRLDRSDHHRPRPHELPRAVLRTTPGLCRPRRPTLDFLADRSARSLAHPGEAGISPSTISPITVNAGARRFARVSAIAWPARAGRISGSCRWRSWAAVRTPRCGAP